MRLWRTRVQEKSLFRGRARSALELQCYALTPLWLATASLALQKSAIGVGLFDLFPGEEENTWSLVGGPQLKCID